MKTCPFDQLSLMAERAGYLPPMITKWQYVSDQGAVFCPSECSILDKKIDRSWYHYLDYPRSEELTPAVVKGGTYTQYRTNHDGDMFRRAGNKGPPPIVPMKMTRNMAPHCHSTTKRGEPINIYVPRAMLETFCSLHDIDTAIDMFSMLPTNSTAILTACITLPLKHTKLIITVGSSAN